MKSIIILSGIYAISLFVQNAEGRSAKSTGTLVVEMTGFRNDQGNVSVALFNQGQAYPKSPEKAVAIIYSRIVNKKASATFDQLPAGEYAVSVYHDENNNKKMDTNIFGIPKEGVGASNDARGHFGPPKYQDAKFYFDGTTKSISIRIVYL
jgi:uncharacterized protein (DUF2141 family)